MKWEKYVNRESMTAPHYLANRYILEHVPVNTSARAVDFGSRDSILPTILADGIVGSVVAVDRDPVVLDQRAAGVSPLYIANLELFEEFAELNVGEFDVVTSCWAIQHNEIADQTRIAIAMSKLLRPGGRLVVVSSLSDKANDKGHRETWHNKNRSDPQWVLSLGDIDKHIANPSGLRWENNTFFWYEHGTRNGDYCGYDRKPWPSAIGYVLGKT